MWPTRRILPRAQSGATGGEATYAHCVQPCHCQARHYCAIAARRAPRPRDRSRGPYRYTYRYTYRYAYRYTYYTHGAHLGRRIGAGSEQRARDVRALEQAGHVERRVALSVLVVGVGLRLY